MHEFPHIAVDTRPDWQKELGESFSAPAALLDYLNIDSNKAGFEALQAHPFPLRVTRAYASRMEKSNAADPLLRQVLPVVEERTRAAGYSDDPVGDLEAKKTPGVLEKYHGRALLITTGHCAINCRYCFRKNFSYSGNLASPGRQDAALHYLETRTEIHEVILSGGDPLVLPDSRLENLLQKLSAIPHIRRLRIHSRIPVVLPSRITTGLLQLLKSTRLKPVIVVHINHPNEIDSEVRNKISKISTYKIPVFNQAVLLKGVNDDPHTLTKLFEDAFDTGILPYYLHMLDKTTGTVHFEVDEQRRDDLQEYLRKTLPGYLLPRFVSEITGAAYKIPV